MSKTLLSRTNIFGLLAVMIAPLAASADVLPLSPSCHRMLTTPSLNRCLERQFRKELEPYLEKASQAESEEGLGMGMRDALRDRHARVTGLEALSGHRELSFFEVENLEHFCQREASKSDCLAKELAHSERKPAKGSFLAGFDSNPDVVRELRTGRLACRSSDGQLRVKGAIDGSGSEASIKIGSHRVHLNGAADRSSALWASRDREGRTSAQLAFTSAAADVRVAPSVEGDWKVVANGKRRLVLRTENTVISFADLASGRTREVKKTARCTIEFVRWQDRTQRPKLALKTNTEVGSAR